MAISVLPLDLERWDEVPRDCLVLSVFKDDRPLRGAAGLADWRMCGRLSRLVDQGPPTTLVTHPATDSILHEREIRQS